MEWYYAEGEERQGPVSEAVFEGLVAEGKIGMDTLVWNESLSGWVTLGALRGGAGMAPPALPDVAQSARAGASGKTTLQRAYFVLLLVEIGLGWVSRVAYAMAGYYFFAAVMQVLFWGGCVLGVMALREQGRGTSRGLRVCVALPLVWGVCNSLVMRLVLYPMVSKVGGWDDGVSDLVQVLYGLGYVSMLVAVGSAVTGLWLLGRKK